MRKKTPTYSAALLMLVSFWLPLCASSRPPGQAGALKPPAHDRFLADGLGFVRIVPYVRTALYNWMLAVGIAPGTYGRDARLFSTSTHAEAPTVLRPPAAGAAATVTLTSLVISPTTVAGGKNVTGNVTLNAPAPAGGTLVTLSDANPATTLPASVLVPAGAANKIFTIKTSPVASNQSGLVAAKLGAVTKTAALTVRPPILTSLTLNPSSVAGGNLVTGTATLDGLAPSTGIVLAVSDNIAATKVPPTVTVAAGTKIKTFTITTTAVTASQSGLVTAKLGTTAKAAALTVRPVALSSLTLSPTSVVGGNAVAGRVALDGPAPPGGAVVTLSDNLPATTLPASVTLAAGTKSRSFTITTAAVAANQTGTVVAARNGVKKVATLTVRRIGVASVKVSPNPVVGGAGATGTVVLERVTPASIVVTLTDNLPSTTVPSTVTVPAGASSKNFAVTTTTVAADQSGLLTASANGVAKSTPLKVTGASNPDVEVETSSPGVVTMSGASTTAFNPVSGTVNFSVAGAVFSADAGDVVAYLNDELVPASGVVLTPTSISLTSILEEGRNHITLRTYDSQGLPIFYETVVWAGSHTLQATILDETGNLIDGALVTARLGDDARVLASGTSVGGQVNIKNVPDRTILLDALANGNRYATIATTGSAGAVQYRLVGFSTPSTVENNDFSLGTADGWNTGTASVQIIPHAEGAAAAAQPADPSAVKAQLNQRQSGLAPSGGPAGAAANPSPSPSNEPLAAGADLDLMLDTAGATIPQSGSRTFKIKPGTKNVTVRYRFITSEVPGGYFGTQYNDYYNVTVRSKQGGGLKTDSQSMNGLGLSSFDTGGRTAWRELTIPADVLGDTVEVNFTVSNVGDGAFQSQLVIDHVEESDFRISKLDLRDKVNGTTYAPLEYLSADQHSYFGITIGGGFTRIYGTVTVEGNQFDGLESLALEILEGGGVKARANLAETIKPNLLKPFGTAGKVEVAVPVLLFELPSSEAFKLNGTTNSTLQLRAVAKSTSGKTVEKKYGLSLGSTELYSEVTKLVRYDGENRFLDRDHDLCKDPQNPGYTCGGDDWVLPEVREIARRMSQAGYGVSWNDFSNMNGGFFTPHKYHQDGRHIDGVYPDYYDSDTKKPGFTSGKKMVEFLNSLPPEDVKKIELIYVTYNPEDPNDPFLQGMKSVTAKEGIDPLKLIQRAGGHEKHFHVWFK